MTNCYSGLYTYIGQASCSHPRNNLKCAVIIKKKKGTENKDYLYWTSLKSFVKYLLLLLSKGLERFVSYISLY